MATSALRNAVRFAWVQYQSIEFCFYHHLLFIKPGIANQVALMLFRVIVNCLNHFLDDRAVIFSESDLIAR